MKIYGAPDYSGITTIDNRRDGRILYLTLNRPERLNAVNGDMHHDLSVVFDQVARDKDVDVVILTGAGRAFCAGGQMDWVRSFPAGRGSDQIVYEARKIIQDILNVPQPIIAAVNGVSAGLGTSIALCCDMIICAQSARIGDPHVKIGLVAGDGGALLWPLMVGPARAKQYLMTGELLPAAEAERIGLVNKVVPDAELDDEARRFAETLLKGSQPAIRGTKLAVNQLMRHLAEVTFDYSLLYEKTTFGSFDVSEGTLAVEEKRAPQFKD